MPDRATARNWQFLLDKEAELRTRRRRNSRLMTKTRLLMRSRTGWPGGLGCLRTDPPGNPLHTHGKRRTQRRQARGGDGPQPGERVEAPGVLTEAGLVARRKEGLQVYYRLNDPLVEKICRLVYDSILQEMQAQREQDSE